VMLGRAMRGHVRPGRHGEYEHVRDGAEISYQPLGGHSRTELAFTVGNVSDIEVRLALFVRVGHGDLHGESPSCKGSRNLLYGMSRGRLQAGFRVLRLDMQGGMAAQVMRPRISCLVKS